MTVYLPTIIIYERHWDLIPKQVTKALLPLLAAEGYDTFCVEAPASLKSEDIIFRSKKAIENDSMIYSQAKSLLTKAHAMPKCKLSDVSFCTLSHLMHQWVSSQLYDVVAEKIKCLPASKWINQIFSTAQAFSITVRGVDVEDTIFTTVTTGNLKNRIPAIKTTEEERTSCFVEELGKLRKTRQGTVFLCGAIHITKTLAKFQEKGVIDDIICYLPHSEKNYDDSSNDIETLKTKYPDLKRCDVLLKTDKQVSEFTKRILADVRSKKIELLTEQTATTRLLTHMFKCQFILAKRPDFYVDALLDLADVRFEEKEIQNKLALADIQTRPLYLHGRMYLSVPHINEAKVANKIRNLWLKTSIKY